jgi:hypothetical protein
MSRNRDDSDAFSAGMDPTRARLSRPSNNVTGISFIVIDPASFAEASLILAASRLRLPKKTIG